MSDSEILEKDIDWSNSCLHKEEKEEVMDMLYKYNEAYRNFTQHKGRNLCNRQVTLFIRPYHVREEDKKVKDKEMKCLCYLVICYLRGIVTIFKSSYVN